MEYQEFLESKIKIEQPKGITVESKEFHHSGKPHLLFDVIGNNV